MKYLLAGLTITIAVVVGLFILLQMRNYLEKQIYDRIARLSGFDADMVHVWKYDWGMPGIAIDQEHQKVLFSKRKMFHILDIEELKGGAIDIDDVTIESANILAQFAGAAAGGAIGGKTGAVLGGLAAPIKATTKVRRVELFINTSNEDCPELRVGFFWSWLGPEKLSSPSVQKAIDEAVRWAEAIMQLSIDRAEMKEHTEAILPVNEGAEQLDTPSIIERTIQQFFEVLAADPEMIYNEFSLQHELGIALRESLGNTWTVQFERPYHYFGIQGTLVKKEIDISIFSAERSQVYALELKYPRQGMYPEQMFSFCKDICFLEQLCKGGMTGAWFVAVVDDRLYYEGNSEGIYAHFRDNKPINGRIEKPTGRDRSYLEIEGSYTPAWVPINDPMRGLVIPINCATSSHRSDLHIPTVVQEEPHSKTSNPSILESAAEGITKSDPNKIFPLKLAQTYYDKGFFNVSVKYDTLVRRADGSIPLVLGSTGKRIQGRINRKANPQTGNARIYGGRELEHWFKLHFKPLETVNVDLSSFNEIRLFKPDE